MKLNYLASWGDVPEKAWSGTYWSMHEALRRNGVELNDFAIVGKNPLLSKLQNALRRVGLYHPKRDMGVEVIAQNRKRLRRIGKDEESIVFQYSEFLLDTPSRHTYLYIDLDVASVVEFNKRNEQFKKYSGFGDIEAKALAKRAQMQGEYMNTCSGIFTMGNWLAKRLVEEEGIPAERVFHVGAGSNMHTELIDESKKAHCRLLFVGRDFERKGLGVVYDAFRILRQRMPHAELYVAGPCQNPISDPVGGYHFVGDVPFNEIAQLYNLCDVFCMPSYFEAYGLVFAEALTFGLPCIGRNAWEMPYFIEDGKTGALIDDDNPEVLAEKMHAILSDDTYQKNVQQRREQYIREYSWDTVAQRMIKVMFP